MTYLKYVETGEAEGIVKEVYDAMAAGPAGSVPPLMQTLSLNPEGLAGFERFYRAISAGGSTLGRRREEMIATAISTWNGCWY